MSSLPPAFPMCLTDRTPGGPPPPASHHADGASGDASGAVRADQTLGECVPRAGRGPHGAGHRSAAGPQWAARAAPRARNAGVGASSSRFRRDGALARVIIPLGRVMAHYFRARVFGADRIPSDTPVIYVGKHPRTFLYGETVLLGLFAFWDAHRPPFRVLEQTDTSLHRTPVLGWMRRHVGAIPATDAHALDALRHGESLLIFPGGARELYGPPDQLRWGGRAGFARLAVAAQVPVVPFAIVGADQQHPLRVSVGRASLWLPPVPLPVPLDFHFGPPLPPPPPAVSSGATAVAIAQYGERVRRATADLLATGLATRRSRRRRA